MRLRYLNSRGIILFTFFCWLTSLGGCDKGADSSSPPSNMSNGSTASSQPAAAASSGAASCKRDQTAKAGLLKIAVIPKGTTHEFWKSIHAGALKAQGELQGVQVIWKGPVKEDDRKAQIDVVENFINQGVSGIAITPLDNSALARPVREATKSGISVVIVDSGLEAEPCKDYASFVATDNFVGGQKAARRLAQVVGAKGSILMLRYQEGSASTMERERGFMDVMTREFPDLQIVSSDQYAGATTESAYAKGENLLNKFPQLDGIFTPNESSTFGMLRALVGSGRAGKVKFVGFDSSEKLVEGLRNGQIHGLVIQDPLNMGYTAVKTLVAYLKGESVQSRIDTGCDVATLENMNDPHMKELLSPPIAKYLNE